MPDTTALVVGAGLSGLTAAGLLARKGYEVDVVDTAPLAGGVMSGRYVNGNSYDNGTHVFVECGIPEVDDLLINPLDLTNGWHKYTSLPSLCFFNGTLSGYSFVDARLLPSQIYQAGFAQMLALNEPQIKFANLEQRIIQTYGEIFASEIFRGSMYKFTGCEMHQLDENAHLPFALNRLICGTSHESILLKKQSSWNDSRLAFHDCNIAKSFSRYLYPKAGGMQSWVDSVVHCLLEDYQVRIHLSSALESFHQASKHFDIRIRGFESKHFDVVIWTVPVFHLLKLLKLDIPSTINSPNSSGIVLFDLEFNAPLSPALSSHYYVTCYDPELLSFRITLYNVLENDISSPARITVEVLFHEGERHFPLQMEKMRIKVISELFRMGILSTGAILVASNISIIPKAYPIKAVGFSEQLNKLLSYARKVAPDVVFVGSASGHSSSQSFLLSDVFNKVSKI